MWKLTFFHKFSDFGFLILRVVVGASFVMHGYPKFFGGPEKWALLGSLAGVPTAQTVFGFLAALAEFGGGVCLILGFMTRVMCLLLVGTMLGALNYHLGKGDNYTAYSHALEMAGVFTGLFFMGPGKYSIDRV